VQQDFLGGCAGIDEGFPLCIGMTESKRPVHSLWPASQAGAKNQKARSFNHKHIAASFFETLSVDSK